MTAAVSGRVDDEGLPLPPPVHGKAARWLLRMLAYGEGVMFLAIAVALLTIAVVVFVRGLHDLVLPPAREPFQVTVTRAVNSVLFIVVVLELLRTIVSRLEGGGFQLQPFLVIGIISATRDILTVGAELSLAWPRRGAARPEHDRTGRQRRRGPRALRGAGPGPALRPAGPRMTGHKSYQRRGYLGGGTAFERHRHLR